MANQRARRLRKNPTDEERIVWQNLRLKRFGGYRFRRQHPIGPYIVDFICLERKLVVEIDGCQHGEERHIGRDSRRTAWLESKGYRVIRIWNRDVRLRLYEALEGVFGGIGEGGKC